MTIQPGSLDYLYYNGVLDYVPQDIYQQPVYVQNNYPMTGSQYIEQAKQGLIYDTYTHPDVFIPQENKAEAKRDFYQKSYGSDGRSYREAILEEANNVKEKSSLIPFWAKATVALSALGITTGILIKKAIKLFKK